MKMISMKWKPIHQYKRNPSPLKKLAIICLLSIKVQIEEQNYIHQVLEWDIPLIRVNCSMHFLKKIKERTKQWVLSIKANGLITIHLTHLSVQGIIILKYRIKHQLKIIPIENWNRVLSKIRGNFKQRIFSYHSRTMILMRWMKSITIKNITWQSKISMVMMINKFKMKSLPHKIKIVMIKSNKMITVMRMKETY